MTLRAFARSSAGIAAIFTVLLRTFYGVCGAIMMPGLNLDPARVYSNAFTADLMSREADPVRYAFIGVWERFDTLWYLHIAQHGYDSAGAVVFYPLYPALIHVCSWLIPSPLVAALSISTVCSFFAMWGLQELVRIDFSADVAIRTVILLAAWPASFMLFAGYADSLVLALTIWSIYFARRNRWWLAGFTGCMGAAAKAVGFLVALPLAWLAWRGERRHLNAAVLPLAPSSAFQIWARLTEHQSSADAYAQMWRTHVVWPWITLLESSRLFFLNNSFNLLFRLNYVFLALTAGLALLTRRRIEYIIYTAAATAMFLAKNTDPALQSTMRYVLGIFPAFIALAGLLKQRAAFVAAVIISLLLNVLFLFEFFNWSLVV